jgi:hypothetical protein
MMSPAVAMAFVDRNFYERQGAEALAAGTEHDCWMQSTNDAVIAMLNCYEHEFVSVVDVGGVARISITTFHWRRRESESSAWISHSTSCVLPI